MNVIQYKCNQERLQKTNKGVNTMTQNYNEEMKWMDTIITELEGMSPVAYSAELSRNNVEIFCTVSTNLSKTRKLKGKYIRLMNVYEHFGEGFFVEYYKLTDFYEIIKEIEELYKQSQKAFKKLK